MEKYRSIKLDEIPYFLSDKISSRINDEEDIKKYIKVDMKCIYKSFLNNSPDYKNKYMKSLLSTKMEANNATILFVNCNNEKNKKSNSMDMAISFSTSEFNKKVLLILNDSIEFKENTQIDIRENIRTTSFTNLDIFTNPFDLIQMSDIIIQLKKIYDIIIIDDLSVKQISKNIKFLKIIDYVALIVNSGKTKITDLKKVYKKIKNVGENLIGIILNNQNITQVYNIEIKHSIKKASNVTYDKKPLKESKKHIEDSKNNISELEKKIDNYKDEMNKLIVSKQEDMKKILEQKMSEMQDTMQQQIKQEIEKTKNEMQQEYKVYKKKAKVDKKRNKTEFALDEEITYKDLKRNAIYVISIKDGRKKERKDNTRKHIFVKKFDKVY